MTGSSLVSSSSYWLRMSPPTKRLSLRPWPKSTPSPTLLARKHTSSIDILNLAEQLIFYVHRFHVGELKDAKAEMIDPAVEGTLTVLKAAKVSKPIAQVTTLG